MGRECCSRRATRALEVLWEAAMSCSALPLLIQTTVYQPGWCLCRFPCMGTCLLEPGLVLQSVPPNTCPLFKLHLLGKQRLWQSLHFSSLFFPSYSCNSFWIHCPVFHRGPESLEMLSVHKQCKTRHPQRRKRPFQCLYGGRREHHQPYLCPGTQASLVLLPKQCLVTIVMASIRIISSAINSSFNFSVPFTPSLPPKWHMINKSKKCFQL